MIIISLVGFMYWIVKDRRNYWRRSIGNLPVCPFGKVEYIVSEIKGVKPQNPKGLISYSLFGDYEKYSTTLLKNIRKIPNLLPGWYTRVYVGIDIPKNVLDNLLTAGAEVYIMGPNPPLGYEGALWRYYPAQELLPFMSLDADDEINSKMVDEINKWVSSGKTFANMMTYAFTIPMGAGLWGARPFVDKHGKLTPAIPNIQNHINQYCEHWFGFDESYLRVNVYPLFQKHGHYQSGNFSPRQITSVIVCIMLLIIGWTFYKAYSNRYCYSKCSNSG